MVLYSIEDIQNEILNFVGTDQYKGFVETVQGDTKEDGFKGALYLFPSILVAKCNQYHTKEPKAVEETDKVARCPSCKRQLTSRGCIKPGIKFCPRCGQELIWKRAIYKDVND